MTKFYRVLFESFDKNNPGEVLSRSTVLEGTIEKPTNCLNFSMGLKNQIELIKIVQDNVVIEKTNLVCEEVKKCPKYKVKLTKIGSHTSNFHDVLTDHTVEIKRLKCRKWDCETPSTVRGIIDTNLSGELKKIQSQLGSTHSYRALSHLKILDNFIFHFPIYLKYILPILEKISQKVSKFFKRIILLQQMRQDHIFLKY